MSSEASLSFLLPGLVRGQSPQYHFFTDDAGVVVGWWGGGINLAAYRISETCDLWGRSTPSEVKHRERARKEKGNF